MSSFAAGFVTVSGINRVSAGISTVKQLHESAFDIKATGRLNRLYIQRILLHLIEWADTRIGITEQNVGYLSDAIAAVVGGA